MDCIYLGEGRRAFTSCVRQLSWRWAARQGFEWDPGFDTLCLRPLVGRCRANAVDSGWARWTSRGVFEVKGAYLAVRCIDVV